MHGIITTITPQYSAKNMSRKAASLQRLRYKERQCSSIIQTIMYYQGSTLQPISKKPTSSQNRNISSCSLWNKHTCHPKATMFIIKFPGSSRPQKPELTFRFCLVEIIEWPCFLPLSTPLPAEYLVLVHTYPSNMDNAIHHIKYQYPMDKCSKAKQRMCTIYWMLIYDTFYVCIKHYPVDKTPSSG